MLQHDMGLYATDMLWACTLQICYGSVRYNAVVCTLQICGGPSCCRIDVGLSATVLCCDSVCYRYAVDLHAIYMLWYVRYRYAVSLHAIDMPWACMLHICYEPVRYRYAMGMNATDILRPCLLQICCGLMYMYAVSLCYRYAAGLCVTDMPDMLCACVP